MLNELVSGQTITGYFLAEKPEVRSASNGKPYLNITLKDQSGSVAGKKWGLTPEENERYNRIQTGMVVQAEITGELFKDQLQCRIKRLRAAGEPDKGRYNIEDLVRSAPEKPEELMEELTDEIYEMKDPDYKEVMFKEISKNEDKLLSSPGAMKIHHAYQGGLIYHIVRMIRIAKKAGEIYGVDMDLLKAGIFFHDLMKIEELNANEYGIVNEYTVRGNLLGHIPMGAIYIDRLNLPEEKKMLLQHIVLSHHGQPEFGSPVRPAFPEAVIINHIDNMDAEIAVMEEEMKEMEAGTMSGWIRALDGRKIFKKG